MYAAESRIQDESATYLPTTLTLTYSTTGGARRPSDEPLLSSSTNASSNEVCDDDPNHELHHDHPDDDAAVGGSAGESPLLDSVSMTTKLSLSVFDFSAEILASSSVSTTGLRLVLLVEVDDDGCDDDEIGGVL